MEKWRRGTALVVLAGLLAGCAGWRYGPALPAGGYRPLPQPVSFPAFEEDRFDTVISGIVTFGLGYLLIQMPLAIGLDDGVFAVPLAGPYIQWEETASCMEGTSCFGMLFNFFGIVATAAQVTGIILFFYGLFQDPD